MYPRDALATYAVSRRASLICIFGALLAAVANGQQITLSPACDLTASQGRQEVDAQCGTLSVPLDRSDPDGETIELFVAVVEALTERPAPDPLVVIAGGPGEAATRFFVTAEVAFRRILRDRAVVLVDQRGTGRSAPLDCGEAVDGPFLSGALDPDALIDAGVACLGSLDHDPRFFTTSAAVADLEQVRIALGYDEVNLYGISYGTRVAQHYLRRFPARTRSVILDGVVPPGLALGPDVALSSQAALDALFGRCEADANCSDEFPDLRRSFEAVLERLRDAPAALSFEHPRTGETVDIVVDRMVVAGVVRLLVYSPQTASLLPVLIDAAHAGDYRGFATQALLVREAMEELSVGLNYAVVCTEDMPYAHPLDLDEQAETYLGTAFVEITAAVCEHWPQGQMDDDLRNPLASDKPVLILSGELDPITPPAYADQAASGLANAVQVVGRGQGHGMLMVGCVPRLMAKFVETAEPGSLDLDCVERIRPFPLFTSRMGPAP